MAEGEGDEKPTEHKAPVIKDPGGLVGMLQGLYRIFGGKDVSDPGKLSSDEKTEVRKQLRRAASSLDKQDRSKN